MIAWMRFAAWLFLTLIWSRDLVSASPLLEKTPLEILQSVAEQKKQKPAFKVSSPDKDYFDSVKNSGFKRVDPLDYSKITDVPRFISIQNKLASSITVEEIAEPLELHRELLFDGASANNDAVLIQDFFPLRPLDFNLLVPNLTRLVYLHSGREIEDVNEKSVITALHQTSPLSALFQRESTFGYPLGYADLTGAMATSMDAHPLYYNQLARQTWEFFRDLQRAREASGEDEEDPMYLEDLDFLGFVRFLKLEGLTFYYPDPTKSNTRIAGMAFLCQLIHWLTPDVYYQYLNTHKNPDITKTIDKVRSFLNENQAVFKPVSSMDQLLENVIGNNILQSLPDQFNPESPAFDFQLPSTYDLREQAHRLSFGFLPESFVFSHYMKASFEVRNQEILAEKERIRLEEIRVRQEREKQRRERMQRSRKPKPDEEEEEAVEEIAEVEEMATEQEETVNSWKTTAAQIVPHTLGKTAALRTYMAIPATAGIQDKTIYLLNGLLLPDVQRAIASTPSYRRSIRPDAYEGSKDMELYILRLTSTDDKETRRDNQYFASSFFLPQQLVAQNMLPLLNHFYMKAIEVSLWNR